MPSTASKRLVVSISPPTLWRHYFDKRQPSDANWRQKRLRVYKRDKYCCIYCGYHSVSGLHIHHENRNPADNRIGNLETVCLMCHLILHAGYAAEVLGILDFYSVARYSQNEIVLVTRRLRAQGMCDKQIEIALGLQDRRPFISDPHYLANLIGFVSSRLPSDGNVSRALSVMYGNERKAPTVLIERAD
jgi:hypothetical protein